MRPGTGEQEGKVKEAEKYKEQGNSFFIQKEYIKALRAYHQANLYLSGLIEKQSPMASYSKQVLSQALEKKVKQLKYSIYMNMGQIYIYQCKYDKAKDILSKAGTIKTTTKLKYRLAVATIGLGELQKSKQLLHEVMAEDPSTKAQVNEQLAKIKQQQKISNESSKKMFAKFFSS